MERLTPAGSAWSMREERQLRGYTIEWAEEKEYILSRRNQVFRSYDLQPPFQHIGSFPAPRWKKTVTQSRLAQRLLRWMYYNIVKLPDDELFVAFDKSIGVIRNGKVELLDSQMSHAFRILRGGIAVDGRGNVFFGEYFPNLERGPVRIYKYDKTSQKLNVAHEFPPGLVRHVHGVFYDPYSNDLWCTTGDIEGECRIMRTHDGFETVEVVGSGEETWRAVSLAFTGQAVYYGTDAEFLQNVLYRIDRSNGNRRELASVSGTVFYNHKAGNDLFFGSTAEMCPSQKEATAEVWRIGSNDECERILSIPKDMYHRILFMLGTIHFPCGPGLPNDIFFHAVALKGADNRTYRLSRTNPGGQ
jgi:hypothetical protein